MLDKLFYFKRFQLIFVFNKRRDYQVLRTRSVCHLDLFKDILYICDTHTLSLWSFQPLNQDQTLWRMYRLCFWNVYLYNLNRFLSDWCGKKKQKTVFFIKKLNSLFFSNLVYKSAYFFMHFELKRKVIQIFWESARYRLYQYRSVYLTFNTPTVNDLRNTKKWTSALLEYEPSYRLR